MTYSAKERRANSKKQLRDADGHFIPKKDSPTKQEVKKKSSVNDPLFSFTINNPFKKLLQWIDYLRKHHTTTFDFKIKVPLIALPFFLFVVVGLLQGFFTLGQYTKKQQIEALPTPSPVVVTETSTIKAPFRSSFLGVIQSTYRLPFLTRSPQKESTTAAQPHQESFKTNRYILLDTDNRVLFLDVSPKILMERYVGKRVLITGRFDPSSQTIQVPSAEDIEIIR